jgi:DNA-binding SARP family transcriptional activator
VLAVLVMNRNRPVGIDSLITAAWEQWPPSEGFEEASRHLTTALAEWRGPVL